MSTTQTNGKICYIEIPTTDIACSAEFYQRVFGWNVRTRNNGSTAFDDTTGHVSGSWVLKRAPMSQPGFLIYVMVDSVDATIELNQCQRRRDRAAHWSGRAGDYGALS